VKILILNLRDHKHPNAGGAEHFTHEVAKRWVAAGHSVTKIASKFKSGANTEVVDGVSIIRMGNYFTVRWKARQHYKKHLKGRFDVVVDEYTNIPFLAPRFVQEPVIFLVFEVVGEKYIVGLPPVVGHFVHYWLEPRWYRYYRSTKTVTISSSTANDLRDLGLRDVEIVPVGISHSPLESVPRKEGASTFLFVGLLKNVNQVGHAVKAFRLIATEIPEATLWVVGRGSELERLKKLASGLPVRFFGYVDEELKSDLMKRAHVVLVPGIREGWGMVITEANSCGTPAIGYNIVGHKDAIRHGETGLLTESTPQAMARAAIRVAKDDGLRNRLSRNALEWSRQFSWDKTANEFIDIIEKLCSAEMNTVLAKDNFSSLPSATSGKTRLPISIRR
jgi:glycosyltransferase involved in cell wall biosynthesis